MFKTLPPLKFKYNLYEHGVTKSMMDLWLQCPQQCKLVYVDALKPEKTPETFIFGDLVHYALERYYQGQTQHVGISNYCKEYFQRHFEPKFSEYSLDEQERLEHILAKAQAVVDAYIIHYSYFDDEFMKESPLGIEESFEYKFGGLIPLRGKLDLKFAEKIVDHKTKSRIDMETDRELYPTDNQLNLYSYVFWKQTGKIPKFVYNIIRQPQHKKSEGLLDKILEKPDHFFHREEYQLHEKELIEWRDNQLIPILSSMQTWFKSDYTRPKYYNPMALRTIYGLSPLYKVILHQDHTGFTRKETPFEELV